MVSIAIAWVLRQPGISSALIGATKPNQLDANLAALDVEFDQELLGHARLFGGRYLAGRLLRVIAS